MGVEAIKLLLLTLLVSTSSVSTIYSNNSSEYSIQTASSISHSVTPIECAEYICNHLTDFEKYYNEANPDLERLTATSVDNLIPLYIENMGKQIDGILIDLNNDFGYITVGYDYEIFDVQAKGDQPFIDYSGVTYQLSIGDGYFYYNKEICDWVSVNKDSLSTEKDWENVKLNHGQYEGQESDKSGNGEIIDTTLYVHDKYDSDYFEFLSASLDMDGYIQSDLSAYETIDNNGKGWTEGNCWIVSAFNVLLYIAKTKCTNMYLTDEVNYDAKQNEPNIYLKHFDKNDRCLETVTKNNGETVDKWQLTNNKFPRLYSIIREYVDGEYKKCDEGYVWETRDIVKYSCNKFKISINTQTQYNWSCYFGYLINEILEGRPALFFTLTGTYGSHAMAVCGFKYYKMTKKYWIFNQTSYKLFFELKDGYSKDSRWFDASGAYYSLGCLVFLEY